MKYLIVGAAGMAGHMIANYLIENGEEVEAIARKELNFCKTYIVDVRNLKKLKNVIESGNFDWIINCVGILNKACDKNVMDAILINSYLPHFIADIVVNTKTRLIHISTDCVFSGMRGGYTELDIPDGETMYDKTKALGEVNDSRNLTFRTSIIGPDMNTDGIGLFNWFMKQKGEINGFEKSIWTGVTTLTLAKAVYTASKLNISGIYNLVNNKIINKYELLELFNKYMKKKLVINKVDGIIQDKSLVNTRKDFSFVVPPYDKQIIEIAEWINSHKKLYAQYFY